MARMTAEDKDRDLVHRAARKGIDIDLDGARTLRRAALVLHRWSEMECGMDGWYIMRDDDGSTWRVTVSPRGEYRYRIRDLAGPALSRAIAVSRRFGFNVTHQPDPRGPSLYLWNRETGRPDPWGGVGVAG